jgi:hypothetical protein
MKSIREYFAEEEGKRKKKTKTRTRPDINLGPDLGGRQDHLPAHNQPAPDQEPPHAEPPQDPRRRAGADQTHRATRGINLDPSAANHIRNIPDMPDVPGYVDREHEIVPHQHQDQVPAHHVTNDNLPAVANNALMNASVATPDWHQVANLPGNMSRAIRNLGRHLFRAFTTTNTDDIYMVGNVMGQGPNTPLEVNSVAHWLRQHGDDLGVGNIDFNAIMPGYNPEIYQYSMAGIRWLLVRDEYGTYIYSWPEHTSVQHQNQHQIGHHAPRLQR